MKHKIAEIEINNPIVGIGLISEINNDDYFDPTNWATYEICDAFNLETEEDAREVLKCFEYIEVDEVIPDKKFVFRFPVNNLIKEEILYTFEKVFMLIDCDFEDHVISYEEFKEAETYINELKKQIEAKFLEGE
ncbi:MAG: hypothetical protein D6732_23560 [Methanobacteriota archaeon]|nr:MAG: hypothetical protein D6732_23560 [Euryarchaeota archaeon]